MPIDAVNFKTTLFLYANATTLIQKYRADKHIRDLTSAFARYQTVVESLDVVTEKEDLLSYLKSADAIILGYITDIIEQGREVFTLLANNMPLQRELLPTFDKLMVKFLGFLEANDQLKIAVSKFSNLRPFFNDDHTLQLEVEQLEKIEDIQRLPEDYLGERKDRYTAVMTSLKPQADKLSLCGLLALVEAESRVANFNIKELKHSVLSIFKEVPMHLSKAEKKLFALNQLQIPDSAAFSFRERFEIAQDVLVNITYSLSKMGINLHDYQIIFSVSKMLEGMAIMRCYPTWKFQEVYQILDKVPLFCSSRTFAPPRPAPVPKSNTVEENRWPKPAKPNFS